MQKVVHIPSVGTPKKANRSRRLRKKLHIGEFSESIISFKFSTANDLNWELPEFDAVLDHLYEKYPSSFFSTGSVILGGDIPGYLSAAEGLELAENFLKEIKAIDPQFEGSELQAVQVGDAWYGDWDNPAYDIFSTGIV